MNYRLNANDLINTLEAWNKVIPGRSKIRLIACGGTALTLLGYKESTKDVDFLVPVENDYKRLTHFLKQAGYAQVTGYVFTRPEEKIIFDLYAGHQIYSTELLTSPLTKGGNKKIQEWSKIYLGAINTIDLIISKMFRGSEADIEDSLTLLKNEKVNMKTLARRYQETARYDTGEERILRNFKVLLARLKDHNENSR